MAFSVSFTEVFVAKCGDFPRKEKMADSAKPAAAAVPAVLTAWLDRHAARLYETSRAQAYGVVLADFRARLVTVGVKYLPAKAGEDEIASFYLALRVEELALAQGCAAGHDPAWTEFMRRFREKMYDAARRIVRDDSVAHELADELYADLYGTKEKDGRRVSKLDFYTGRGSLEGWLRTVLAQEYINRYRKQRHTVSLEEQEEAGAQFVAGEVVADPPVDARLVAATDAALASLAAEDRYVLAAYFLDGKTLAEIARVLRVHESTISRKVEKITRELRKAVLDALCRCGMSRRQAEEALDADVRDLPVNVRGKLAQESRARAFDNRRPETGG